jgi:hypothetical protein
MVDTPHLFADLCYVSDRGQVDGIGKDLEIRGEVTFKFSIEEDNKKVQTIKIPNSLYLPDLRVHFLLPKHWARRQEMGKHGWGITHKSVD